MIEFGEYILENFVVIIQFKKLSPCLLSKMVCVCVCVYIYIFIYI